jgi:hypothetical protein
MTAKKIVKIGIYDQSQENKLFLYSELERGQGVLAKLEIPNLEGITQEFLIKFSSMTVHGLAQKVRTVEFVHLLPVNLWSNDIKDYKYSDELKKISSYMQQLSSASVGVRISDKQFVFGGHGYIRRYLRE